MSNKPIIPGGYLSFPHRLLKRATDLSMSGSQWKALACAIYQGIGNKSNQQKGTFQLGLSVLQKRGNMSKAEAWRSREFLVKEGFIIETKAPDISHAKAAEYRFNYASYENGTVPKPERLRKRKHDAGDTLSDTQSSEKPFPNGNSPCYETGTVTVTKPKPNGYETGTEDRSIDNTSDRNLKKITAPPAPAGGALEATQAVASSPAAEASPSLSPNLFDIEKPKPDPERYKQLFKDEMGIKGKLAGIRKTEISTLLVNIDERRFQIKFTQLLQKYKNIEIPEEREQCKLFWGLATHAKNLVMRNS